MIMTVSLYPGLNWLCSKDLKKKKRRHHVAVIHCANRKTACMNRALLNLGNRKASILALTNIELS